MRSAGANLLRLDACVKTACRSAASSVCGCRLPGRYSFSALLHAATMTCEPPEPRTVKASSCAVRWERAQSILELGRTMILEDAVQIGLGTTVATIRPKHAT